MSHPSHWVDTVEDAAPLAAELGETVFVSTGRPTLDVFAQHLVSVVARVDEPVTEDAVLPEGWLIVLDRGPYTMEEERAMLVEHGVAVLVARESGDDALRDAAAELGIEVIVVRRPGGPEVNPRPAVG